MGDKKILAGRVHRWSSYKVTIVWGLAWADSALVVLDEWSSYRGRFICGRISRFDCISLFYIFYLTYASNVRTACIIAPYNAGLRGPLRLSGRGRSCLALARCGFFGLSIAPNEKLSRLFNPVFIQE